jgi:hypothetical protein
MPALSALPLLALLADAPTPDTHRLRIHVDMRPLTVRIYESDSGRSSGVHLGVPGWVSLGFGVAPHPAVVVGARFGGSFNASKSEYVQGGSTRMRGGDISVSPYVELRPAPALRVQPFVALDGSVSYSVTHHDVNTPTVRLEDEHHGVGAGMNARIGMHAFVLPRLSIDADLGGGPGWSWIVCPRPVRPSTRSWHMSATLGVSGWF